MGKKIAERLLELVSLHTAGKHTVFARQAGIPHGTFSAYIKGRVPHVEHLCRIQDTYKVNINWLLTGKGKKYIDKDKSEKELQVSESISLYKVGILDKNPEIVDLLEGAKKVLKSGNKVAFEALERNIRYFSQAVDDQEELETTKTELNKAKKQINRVESRVAAIERQCLQHSKENIKMDPLQKKEEFIKKKVI